jgi:hypothetical protein
VFEKCRRAVYNSPWVCRPGELLALLDIALYVEPRSAVLEKLRRAINHSHSIMKHILGEMDATKEFIFKAFMCFRCTFKAFGVILWHFKVVQMNQGYFFKNNLFCFLSRDFTGASAMAPLKSEGLQDSRLQHP